MEVFIILCFVIFGILMTDNFKENNSIQEQKKYSQELEYFLHKAEECTGVDRKYLNKKEPLLKRIKKFIVKPFK